MGLCGTKVRDADLAVPPISPKSAAKAAGPLANVVPDIPGIIVHSRHDEPKLPEQTETKPPREPDLPLPEQTEPSPEPAPDFPKPEFTKQEIAAMAVTTVKAMVERCSKLHEGQVFPTLLSDVFQNETEPRTSKSERKRPSDGPAVRVSLRACVEVVGDVEEQPEKIALNTNARSSIRRGTGTISEEFTRRLIQYVPEPTFDADSDAETVDDLPLIKLQSESSREKRLSQIESNVEYPRPKRSVMAAEPLEDPVCIDNFQPLLVQFEEDCDIRTHEGGWRVPDTEEECPTGRTVRFSMDAASEGHGSNKSAGSHVKEKEVNFEDSASSVSHTTNMSVRKVTGFMHKSDLPSSDEDDIRDASSPTKNAAGSNRQGTGFIRAEDLPSSEDDDDAVQASKTKNAAAKTKTAISKCRSDVRQATGFLRAEDLPSSDESEDETRKVVNFHGTVSEKRISCVAISASTTGGTVKKETRSERKVTGFLRMSDLPSSSESDSEKPGKASASICPKTVGGDGDTLGRLPLKDGELTQKRQCTAYVRMPSSLEVEDSEPVAPKQASASQCEDPISNAPQQSVAPKQASASQCEDPISNAPHQSVSREDTRKKATRGILSGLRNGALVKLADEMEAAETQISPECPGFGEKTALGAKEEGRAADGAVLNKGVVTKEDEGTGECAGKEDCAFAEEGAVAKKVCQAVLAQVVTKGECDAKDPDRGETAPKVCTFASDTDNTPSRGKNQNLPMRKITGFTYENEESD